MTSLSLTIFVVVVVIKYALGLFYIFLRFIKCERVKKKLLKIWVCVRFNREKNVKKVGI